MRSLLHFLVDRTLSLFCKPKTGDRSVKEERFTLMMKNELQKIEKLDSSKYTHWSIHIRRIQKEDKKENEARILDDMCKTEVCKTQECVHDMQREELRHRIASWQRAMIKPREKALTTEILMFDVWCQCIFFSSFSCRMIKTEDFLVWMLMRSESGIEWYFVLTIRMGKMYLSDRVSQDAKVCTTVLTSVLNIDWTNSNEELYTCYCRCSKSV